MAKREFLQAIEVVTARRQFLVARTVTLEVPIGRYCTIEEAQRHLEDEIDLDAAWNELETRLSDGDDEGTAVYEVNQYGDRVAQIYARPVEEEEVVSLSKGGEA